MRIHLTRQKALALVALIIVAALFVDVAAQQRRRRRSSRRITNPTVSAPDTQETPLPDAKIISTADENQGNAQPSPTPRNRTRTNTSDANSDEMRRTIIGLSNEVNRLTDRIGQMQEQQRAMVDLERLTHAEQRAESLRTQLRDVLSKESDYQARLDQIENDMRPENIDRSVATYGSTHPEEIRDQRRRALESERTRVRAQIDLLERSRTSLEASVASAESEVDTLRLRIEAASASGNATDTNTTTTNVARPVPSPSPTPSPENPPQ